MYTFRDDTRVGKKKSLKSQWISCSYYKRFYKVLRTKRSLKFAFKRFIFLVTQRWKSICIKETNNVDNHSSSLTRLPKTAAGTACVSTSETKNRFVKKRYQPVLSSSSSSSSSPPPISISSGFSVVLCWVVLLAPRIKEIFPLFFCCCSATWKII